MPLFLSCVLSVPARIDVLYCKENYFMLFIGLHQDNCLKGVLFRPFFLWIVWGVLQAATAESEDRLLHLKPRSCKSTSRLPGVCVCVSSVSLLFLAPHPPAHEK